MKKVLLNQGLFLQHELTIKPTIK